MRTPLETVLSLRAFLFLSALLFSANVLASPANIKIVSRQSTGLAPGTILNTALACQQYSRIANLSAIGTNSTLRATFIDVNPSGTLAVAALLNGAQLALPVLTADAALNQACGNLTTIATTEAANNFTRGIVGQFTFTGSHTSVVNGWPVIFSTLAALAIIVGPLTAL